MPLLTRPKQAGEAIIVFHFYVNLGSILRFTREEG